MTVIGYMRVSTPQQKFDSQERALQKYGVDIIYQEHVSGTNSNRKELNKALALLKTGDTFVIFKLDRLARGTKHLLSLMDEFEKRGINFVSIQNHIDTTTPMGKFFFTVMGAFAEMEAEIIRERVKSGLDAARENGKTLGRPTREKAATKAVQLYLTTDLTVAAIAKKCRISVPTLYNYLAQENIPRNQRGHLKKIKQVANK
ncbi:recombinase family protein [Vagococcus sp. BWB3-3]|uniref:Recombinase family protein n=1 Tax=Vagococcus allomyrinae TaxID=2794353 RepID=A0A940SQT1_9ENTE|nr:recombinase family protein [Vagococcus allomyrinae]MBP1040047.1 recombinase family protein [Vagococcus allomyrinae]